MTLVVLVCALTGAPCRDVEFVLGPACIVAAQAAIAEYVADHPELRVERWRCRGARR